MGGALYVAGNLYMSNCLFYLNSATAGASAGAEVTFDGGGSSGSAGGSATGGGLCVGLMAAKADVENTVFFNNSCAGGASGNALSRGRYLRRGWRFGPWRGVSIAGAVQGKNRHAVATVGHQYPDSWHQRRRNVQFRLSRQRIGMANLRERRKADIE